MIKKIVGLFFSAVFILLCSGCNTIENSGDNTITVYYVSNTDYKDGGRFVEPVQYSIASEDDAVYMAIEYLSSQPTDTKISSPLIKGTRIYSYTINDKTIDVEISGAYTGLSELEKTAVKSCFTLTLCAVDGIDFVNLIVDGITVERLLSRDMFISDDAETDEFEKRIQLYFPDTGCNYLVPEARMITVGKDRLLAEYVMEELISSSQNLVYEGFIPAGTKLLDIEQKSGVCTINLSGEFIEKRAKTAAGQRMCIYSIVNSLAAIDGVEKVRFHIDGSESRGYEYIDLGAVFTAFDDIIYNSQSIYDITAAVYLGLRDNTMLVRIPVIISRDTTYSLEENIVKYILSSGNVSGYIKSVPRGVELIDIETNNRKCTVNLDKNLFSNGTGSAARRAAYAIAYAIIDTGNADSVTIKSDGITYIENVEKDNDNIIE